MSGCFSKLCHMLTNVALAQANQKAQPRRERSILEGMIHWEPLL